MRICLNLAVLFAISASVLTAQRASVVAPSLKAPGPVALSGKRVSRQFVIGMVLGGDLEQAVQALGAEIIEQIPGPSPVGLIRARRSLPITIGMIESNPSIDFVEPLRWIGAPLAPGCAAADSSTTSLSGSGCIAFYDGDPSPSEYFNQPALAALNVSSVHPYLVGNLSIVAVIDTGIDALHPMLAGRVLPYGYDFVDRDTDPTEVANGLDDDGDGLIDEAYGHGTHAAGSITLLNPDARILPLRVLDSDGNGTSFGVAQAVYFAIASGADVINLSLGMNETSSAVHQAIHSALDLGIEVLAAVGNSNVQLIQFPARMNDVIAIAAVDELEQKSSFSSFGLAVEICAPGSNIYSTMPGGQFAWWSGTSMATAVASGAASLLNSLAGSPFEIEPKDLLKNTSLNIEDFNPQYDELLGDGRIDPLAAAVLLISGQ